MTQDEALDWFNRVATPIINNNSGLFCTIYTVYENNDSYSFTIGYNPYSCNVITENGCDDCPYRTIHGDCGEYSLYINGDGTIYYEGSGKTYGEDKFEELLNEFV